jgi:hypothetical protein
MHLTTEAKQGLKDLIIYTNMLKHYN